MHTYDVEFSGFGGHRIGGWLLAPRDATGPLPCMVQYIGYSGGRGLPHNWLLWPSVGYAVFVMDSCGQGASPNNPGTTPDPVGGSQGGGMALAAAGLVPDLTAALVDVPFMTHIRRAVEITDADPYGEVARFCAGRRDLVDQVLATLDHFEQIAFLRGLLG